MCPDVFYYTSSSKSQDGLTFCMFRLRTISIIISLLFIFLFSLLLSWDEKETAINPSNSVLITQKCEVKQVAGKKERFKFILGRSLLLTSLHHHFPGTLAGLNVVSRRILIPFVSFDWKWRHQCAQAVGRGPQSETIWPVIFLSKLIQTNMV